MSKIRKSARGQECQVRLPGICNGNPETTVLAHYRMAGMCGMGIKPPDFMGAYACSACHDEIDRRTRHLDTENGIPFFTNAAGYPVVSRSVLEGKPQKHKPDKPRWQPAV